MMGRGDFSAPGEATPPSLRGGARLTRRVSSSGGQAAIHGDGWGEAVLTRPLLLHASSQATAPKHRRVLHVVYHSGRPIPETWHRRVG